MDKFDFRNQLDRLARGFDRPELSDERLLAMFDRFGHVPLEAFEYAVSDALCGDRYPTLDRLHALTEASWERFRLRESKKMDQIAKSFLETALPESTDHLETPDHPAVQFYRLTREQGVPKAQAAEVLGPVGSFIRDYTDRYGHPPFWLSESWYLRNGGVPSPESPNQPSVRVF